MNSPQLPLFIRFATFELDLRARELRKDGRSTGLPDQSITVLAMLLEKPGDLLLREDIRTKLWPNDTVVEFDHSINTAIGRLRQALGDSAENSKYIETLPRRGYRWIGPALSREGREQVEKTPATAAEPGPQRIANTNLIGKKVCHYRVLEVLGGGGMGVVYKAEDLKLGRRVALKFLPEEIASDINARQRFESEARSASALNHPNICTIYSVEEYEGLPFLSMELLQGQTLRDLIATVPGSKPQLDLRNLLDIAVRIISGLEAAHKQGIIHRDIKPANIFITSEGQAKILDFGLAKLTLSESEPIDSAKAESREEPFSYRHAREVESLTASSPFLSHTGVAMGTAGYMSPEQVRGEKLDARTDLFSFGLVLYEMATGKRAFSGATGPELKKSILTQIPTPARKENPELPEKFAKLVHRTLEKNREKRYQSASETRADLENLKREIQSGTSARRWALATAAVAVLVFISAAYWFANRQPPPSGALPEIKLRQLTTNSSENKVDSGAISPDGKYLAYVDKLGMHLKLIQTGEVRAISQPEEIKSNGFEWRFETGAWWFPDSTRFLASLHPQGISGNDLNSQNSSIWVVSVLGGPPHKLRDAAYLSGISPDGSLIAFDANHGRISDREIWVMQPDGAQAHRVFEIDEKGAIDGFSWSPDGQRVFYMKTELKDKSASPRWEVNYSSFRVPMDDLNQSMMTGDLRGGPQKTLVLPFDLKAINDYLWLPDGRMIYQQLDNGFNTSTCNLWQVLLDQHTNEFIGKPQRITNFPAVCIADLSVTSDGKHLVFLESKTHAGIYVADLQAGGTRIFNPTRLTLDEGWNNPAAWSADSKVVFFSSNRNGKMTLFRQALGQDTAEALFPIGEHESLEGGVCLSPDGAWLLFGPVIESRPPKLKKIMRVPIAGGSPQVIYTGDLLLGTSCSRFPATLCVIAERSTDRKQLLFDAFDPVQGRGSKLAEFAMEPTAGYEWKLSPDGTRIAIVGPDKARIHILWLNGQGPQEIAVKGWKSLSGLYWAADGKGFFVSSIKEQEPVIVHVDMQGNARLLWEVQGGTSTYAVPSPDGRHLAMQKKTVEGNLWMMENF